MAVNVDELKTIMAVAGQQNYMAAMWSAARATQNLQQTTVHANKAMGESSDAYFDKLSQRWRDAESGQFLAQKKMMGGGVAAALATALAAEIALLAAALRLAGTAFREVTTAGREFEAVMKDVENQSKATRDEMQRIKDAALAPELQKLGVGGKEAAMGYKELSSYGYSAVEMQAAMLSITQAAVATGADQAEMTRAMLGIMNQYKLSISDMPAIADAMTEALNQTSFQINDFMLAMKYAGPIAGSMGWSMGETAAVLDQLNKTFVNAEMSGTGFRGFMNTLLAPSAEAAAAFADAGLNIEDFRYVMNDAGAMLEWFQSGAWDSSLIMKAFGAEAGNAAAVLWRASVPAVEQAGTAINTTGNVAKDAENKMASLDGSVKQLSAAYEDMKIKLYNITQAISVDFIQAIKLAVDAVSSYLGTTQKELQKTDSQGGKSRDRVLELAEAFVIGGGMIVKAAIQVSRFVAMQARQIVQLAQHVQVLRLGYLELSYAWAYVWGNTEKMQGLSKQMDAVKAEIAKLGDAKDALTTWAIGGGASDAIKSVDKFEADLLTRIKEMRAKALAAAKDASTQSGTPLPGNGKGAPTANPQKPTGALPAKDPQQGALDAAKQQLDIDLQRLAIWEKMAKAQAATPAQEAMITLAAREREVQLYRQMEQITYRVSRDEKAKQEATLARMNAEAEAATVRKQIVQTAAREQEQQRVNALQEQEQMRQDSAREMEQIGERANAVSRAIQSVIGGSITERVREQLDRLSGAGLGNGAGYLKGIRPSGDNRIVLELRYPTQVGPNERAQTTGWLLDAIRDAGRRAPVGG